MRVSHIKDSSGWIAGAFNEALIQTDSFEVGYKSGKAHCDEARHYHSRSVEHTFVIKGKCMVSHEGGYATELNKGDMITIEMGEVIVWDWLTDWETLVIRTPMITRDKVIIE